MSSDRGAVERLVLQLRGLRISIERSATPPEDREASPAESFERWRLSPLQAPRLQLDHLPGRTPPPEGPPNLHLPRISLRLRVQLLWKLWIWGLTRASLETLLPCLAGQPEPESLELTVQAFLRLLFFRESRAISLALRGSP